MMCLTVFSVVTKILLFFPLIYAFCGHDGMMSWSMNLEGRSWLALLILLGASIMLLGGLVDSFLTYMSPAKRIADSILDEDDHRIVKKPRLGNQHDKKRKGNKDEDMQDCDVEIDENLYSRQLAIYGRETMRRLFNSSVLVTGVGGLGAEVAKNLVLAGVKSVVLHDVDDVEIGDLSSNFLLTEDDIGKNRAVASLDKLQELNTSVEVSAWTYRISKEDLSWFQAVVFTEISLERAIEFDDYCRSQSPPIAFIKGEIRGLFGSVFCDFGPKFTVFDVKGEEPHTGIIAHISNENPAFVSCVEDERLDFQDGDMVIFTEVEGMTELNDGKPRKIKSLKPYGFILEEDTTKFGAYKKGGIVTEVFQPKELYFKPLKEALEDPGEFILCDSSKDDRPFLLHLAFQALDKFVSEFLRFPVAGSVEDASKIVSFASSINENSGSHKPDIIDEKVLRVFSSGSRAVLNPMAAMFGGIIGQEVVKACSAKFHPIFQFFYFDSVESLPVDPLRLEDVMPQNSRYDAQISVFGREMQQKLEESKIFIVGAGALGCEFLKNLALMGACCGGQGKLIITDDDVIERSNLNRQFLFRDWNIGQHKSTIAASAARKINPSLQIEALQNRVSSESENIFNDAFWENLEIVISGLDNVDARLYVDSRCVYFQKPLLESGTLGTKCHTQMVIPNLTENYGASRDPPEKETPLCTIHSFPHNIDHCLTWARSEFEGLFEKTPADANSFLEKPEEFKKSLNLGGDMQAQTLLESILECLVSERCKTFEDCVAWSRIKFEDYFVNRVKQLVHQFPENAMTSANTPFWAPPKRFPKPLQFESTDPSHLSFIIAGSILRAQTYGIPIQPWATNKHELAEFLKAIDVPDFHPKTEVRIVTDENTTSINSVATDDTNINESMIQKLQQEFKKLPSGFRLSPIHFEKDDDKHVDFIVGLGNMRARNYGIPEVDKLKAKIIAGRIIPAIATTTAMTTGLVCLELYKVLAGHGIEKYRNTFANLGLSIFAMSEPVPPKRIKHENLSWTPWDRWIIRENLTVQELLEWFRAKGLTAYAISCGGVFLYNRFFPKHTERLSQKVIDLVKTTGKLPSNRCRCDITVFCEDGNGNEVDIPGVTICWS